jgi:pimeloyl-ACP methyl ester carboxylesterase
MSSAASAPTPVGDGEYTLAIRIAGGCETISCVEASRGAHTILAFHGVTSVNRFWDWEPLWPEGRLILAGLPGHGPVPHYPRAHYERWTPDYFTDLAAAVARQHYRGRKMTVVGNSMGGLLALGVALKAPEVVQRLILLSPLVWHDISGVLKLFVYLRSWPRLARLAAFALLLPARRLSPRLLRRAVGLLVANRKALHSSVKALQGIRAGVPDFRRSSPEALAKALQVCARADLRSAIRKAHLRLPTLIIHGALDPVVPVAQARWLADNLGSSTLAVVPNCGHIPQYEAAQTLNDTVAAWIEANPVPATRTSSGQEER